MASGSIYCDNCLEHYGWQHLSAVKEATTKDGGATSSPKKGAMRSGSRSPASWVESLAATSKSKPSSEDW